MRAVKGSLATPSLRECEDSVRGGGQSQATLLEREDRASLERACSGGSGRGFYAIFFIYSVTSVWGWGTMSIPFLPWLLTR